MSTTDGLQNILTGLGTEKDKNFSTFFGLGLMDRAQLDAAYRGDWIARKGIDIPAFDTTREWRSWQADKDDVTEIETIESKFRVQLKVMKAMVLGRLYGGGGLIMGVDQGNPEDELIVDDVQQDELKFLHIVSRFDLATGPINWDITSPYYGRPSYYTPTNIGNSTLTPALKLHPSRVIAFCGNDIPNVQEAQGWGDSVLQSASDAVLSAGVVMASTAQMVSEAKLDVIKIPGLSENIVSTEYENNLKKRFAFANTAKSVFGIILLDAAEEWERIQTQFAALPDVLKMYLMSAAGAFDVPATRFLSQSPTGMNATGDSDTRNYYDRLGTEQKVFVQPTLEPLDKVLLRSSLGDVPEDEMKEMWYTWNPLWQQSESEKGTNSKTKAEAFKIDVDSGLLNEVVLKKAREAQLIADGTYPGLQQIINDFDDDPDLEQAKADEEEAAKQAALLPPPDPNNPLAKQVPNAPPKQLAPPKKGQPQKAFAPPSKTNNKAAVDGIAKRINDATRPRSLYVRRDLINVSALRAWAEKQGFKSVISDFHVTILYSKVPVDWLKIGADEFRSDPDGGLVVKAGGPRVIERFNSAVVLCFANSDIQYRHRSMMYRGKDDGITWGYEDYTPHVTITYEGGELDLESIVPYAGELRFGPEIFEEIKGSYDPGPEKKLSDEQQVYNMMLVDAVRGLQRAPDVTVNVTVPKAGHKEKVVVTKLDATGRVTEFEKTVTPTDEQD